MILSPTVAVIAVLLIVAAWLSQWLATNDLQSFRDSLGLSAALIVIPVHVVLALTPFPSDVVAIANGAMFGFFVGALLNWIGWWIAAVCQFELGRRARQDFDLANTSSKMPLWLRNLPFSHPIYLIGVRQIPWLGMHAASFVPGAAGVRFSRFLWCSTVGAIPGSILMSAIGAGLMHWGTKN